MVFKRSFSSKFVNGTQDPPPLHGKCNFKFLFWLLDPFPQIVILGKRKIETFFTPVLPSFPLNLDNLLLILSEQCMCQAHFGLSWFNLSGELLTRWQWRILHKLLSSSLAAADSDYFLQRRILAILKREKLTSYILYLDILWYL